jgi:triphosphoribosyl-dephospho-CoA synthase
MNLEDCNRQACLWEVEARKLGNVHPGASFANTTADDFRRSAEAIAQVLALACKQPLGRVIREAVEATQLAVGQNTNLGIILLLAPLAAVPAGQSLRDGVEQVLAATTLADAEELFTAIRLAQPGGLNAAQEQDVRDTPTVTLREAMSLAQDRDMIARQYHNGFQEVFDFGVPALIEGVKFHGNLEAGIVECHCRWLAEFPDSLIARKRGIDVASTVRDRAKALQALGGLRTTEGRSAGREFDAYLRSQGNRLNPGTSADLVAACLFAALRENELSTTTPFPWPVTDWL